MVRQRSRSLLPPPHAGRMPTRQNAAPEPSWTFVLSGGVVCLDFANTLSWRWSGQPIERLTSYGRLVSWAKQDGIVTGGEAARLRRVAARQPARAQLVLTRGVALREAVFHIFSAVVARRAVPGRAMALLNYILARALTHRTVQARRGQFAWTWTERDELERILWPVAVSAVELLLSERHRRIRLCAAETCGWIFLDTTRNQRRRWCSMQVCGNRAKVRRHYRRSKEH